MPADVPDGDDAAGEGAVSVQTDVSAGGLSIWFLQSQQRQSLYFAFDSLRLALVNNSLIFFGSCQQFLDFFLLIDLQIQRPFEQQKCAGPRPGEQHRVQKRLQ